MKKLKSKKKQQTLDLIQFFRYLLGVNFSKSLFAAQSFFFSCKQKQKKDGRKRFSRWETGSFPVIFAHLTTTSFQTSFPPHMKPALVFFFILFLLLSF